MDKTRKSNLSLAVAKREGIRHANLPLRRVIGMQYVLNVEIMMGILCDYRLTRDWMYAFRHLPPRMFKNNLKDGYTKREEAVYWAHKTLHPNSTFFSDNAMMGPTAYREKYIEFLKAAPNDGTIHDGEKYRPKIPSQKKFQNPIY